MAAGKSSLAQQLASRLNLPNVLQTDVLYEVGGGEGGSPLSCCVLCCGGCCPLHAVPRTLELPNPPLVLTVLCLGSVVAPSPGSQLLRGSGAGDLPAEPLWRRPLAPGASLVPEFQRECATIRRALDGDLCKVGHGSGRLCGRPSPGHGGRAVQGQPSAHVASTQPRLLPAPPPARPNTPPRTPPLPQCIRDGKSIIIEGLHIDPGLFLLEFGDPRGGGSPVTQPEPGGAQQDEGGDLVGLPGALQGAAGQPAGLQVRWEHSMHHAVIAFLHAAAVC